MITPCHSEPNREPWKAPVVYPASISINDAKKIIVEVGPGRGDFLYHLAEANPDAVVVGIEIKPKRTDLLIARLQKRGISNVMLVQGDARDALPRFFKEESICEIHINFPDPWPKRRHGRNRVMSEKFLHTCMRALKPSGSIFFATDDKPYADAVLKIVSRIEGLASGIEGGVAQNLADAFPTFFAKKWKGMGRTLYYQRYVKRDL